LYFPIIVVTFKNLLQFAMVYEYLGVRSVQLYYYFLFSLALIDIEVLVVAFLAVSL
jgi:hypothetical protein